MNKVLITLTILAIFIGCQQDTKSIFRNNTFVFEIFLRPAFNESAKIVLTKTDTIQDIRFLLREIQRHDSPMDTFYFRTFSMSRKQFESFDSAVISKTKISQPAQWEGCCDGMPVTFTLIQDRDTSQLYFRSPSIKADTIGYKITRSLIDYFRSNVQDSIINDYLDDVESYMDESKRSIHAKDNRAINKLRKNH